MFYKSLLLLLFIFVSLLNSQELGEDTIVLEANEAPPFWSKGLPHDGMAGEIIYEMSKVAKLKSVIKFKPLSRLIEDDTNNDLGNPSFYINNQDFGAIIPIAIYHVSMYYYAPNHKKKLTFRSIEDLKGFKIGILKGTVVDHAYFQKHGVLFEESYTQEALFRKLKLGRIDMLIEIELVAKQILNNLFSKEKNNFIEIAFLKSSYPIAIMLSEDLPNIDFIKNQYNKALTTIIENGIYMNILRKYYLDEDIPDSWFNNLNRFKQMYKIEE